MSINKIANCIRILTLLQKNGRMTREQLAMAINVDKRTVHNYITDIYEAGFQIETITGRYGGYILHSKPSRILASMTSEEYAVCLQADKFLEQKQFVNHDIFRQAIDKIALANSAREVNVYTSHTLEQYMSNAEVCEADKRYFHIIEDAIRDRHKMKMVYNSLRSGESCRTIHPYGTFAYQSAMYVVGYCERRNQVLYFKLARIKELKVIAHTYEVIHTYNIQEMLGKSIGLFYDKSYDVKIKIQYPMSYIIKERHVVEGQKITELEDKSIIFEGELTGLEDIKRWVLSLGIDAEVIEPAELRDVIAYEILEMAKKYNK